VLNSLLEDILKTASIYENSIDSSEIFNSFNEVQELIKSAKKSKKPKVKKFKNGIVINGEFGSPEVAKILKKWEGKLPLVVSDPPYSGIVKDEWDQNIGADDYVRWTKDMLKYLKPKGSMYVWGCYGKPGNRTYFEYLSRVEKETGMTMQNVITWSKKRAYGTQYNYLHTSEYVAWLTNGERPGKFKVPLLDIERGYAGYNKSYPALSKFLRRTNVWSVNELFKGKIHPTEKPTKLAEIMIETHTKKGDWVMDPFGGSGSSGEAAIKLGRKFILVERDPTYFKAIINRLEKLEK